MGEEAKQEKVKGEETKPEEKKDEKAEEPKPPTPVVLFVDLHCVGCARKIERTLMRVRGVEEVGIDMAKNQVTIQGIVDPQSLCLKIQKKTKRRATVLSSPPPPPEGDPTPQFYVHGIGVQTAETNMSTGKVTVTGTMDADGLVEYVKRSTRKQARVVPQPKPKPEPEKSEEKKEGEKSIEEGVKPKGEKKEEKKAPEEEKKEDSKGTEEKGSEENKEETKKVEGEEIMNQDETMKRMMHYYEPLYVIERIPAPQIFSDENPNACCIS
ncbi:hypothetical protein GIB67_033207 [Kingdonia uniflora]|uniref:HMA domain-containing protein n=1 Tax=Kingdonia uniflora TaxID=39325 RepID=A0A7J7MPU8_9MAGN|nr:hypothetical protein GIB67_033207 [Kingdonia uniflora]